VPGCICVRANKTFKKTKIEPDTRRGYKMSSKLMEYFNRSPRIGTLSTASRDGTVDSAVFGRHI